MELQRYLMGVQLRKVGDQLKAAVKTEEAPDDGEAPGLGWSMEVEEVEPHRDAEEVEADQDAEEDMHDEEIEEEEPAHDAHHDEWTNEDWGKVKAMAADEVVDVDEWASKEAHSSTKKWAIKAPWAAKRPKAARPVRTDAWGGVCWSDGWYKDKDGKWWPYLSNSLAVLIVDPMYNCQGSILRYTKFCLWTRYLFRVLYTKFCLLTRSLFRILLLVCFVDPMVSFLLHVSSLFLGLGLAEPGREPRARGCWHARLRRHQAVEGWVVQKFPGFNFNSSGIIM